HDADALVILAALESFDPDLDWSRVGFANVDDQDWERAWMDQYAPLQFGRRTWIVPWNQELPADADRADAATLAAKVAGGPVAGTDDHAGFLAEVEGLRAEL
ncbi:hypothetical protein HKX41_10980, partial [Salinisphaera sp. USBA-960]|nr:hypothetical protein [Salifodinibacter halophilus]